MSILSGVEFNAACARIRIHGGDPPDGDEFEEDGKIDDEMLGFNPEPSIRHNVLPDSDSESEEESKNKNTVIRLEGNQNDLFVGQRFYNKAAFSQAVLDHALKNGRNIKQYRFDKTKIGYNCVGGNCWWKVYCSRISESDEWELRFFKDKHSCHPNGECHLMKVPIIAELFRDKLRDDPDLFMPKVIEELILQQWKIKVSRGQCQVARIRALKWIEEEYEQQFKRLRDYKAEILLSYPGSTVVVETNTNVEGLDLFHRFYVCFDVLRRSWKDTCRQVIGVDGCFLKGNMRGQLLVAIGRDADNSIYPIAWGVVPIEDTDNWLWFMRKLKADLDIGDGKSYVLASDRQKGLRNAVEQEFPCIEHRMCVRHIYANLKKKHGKKPEMKLLVWNLSWSYNNVEYKKNLNNIMAFDIGVYRDVMNTKPETWCRAFYKLGSDCEEVDNNSVESFNATIVKARKKPMVPMLELLARQAMVRIHKRFIKASEHEGRITPYAKELLDEEYPKTAECRVFSSTNHMYQVMCGGCSFQVSLNLRSCSCRKWDLRGIPCEHGYAVILHKRFEVEDYVNQWFRTAMWKRTYTDGLVPTRGADFWPIGTSPEVHMAPSPPQPGRKKKSRCKSQQERKRGVNESPIKKAPLKKRVMHCKVCGAANHNSRYHSRKRGVRQTGTGDSSLVVPNLIDAYEGEGSQGVIPQDS